MGALRVLIVPSLDAVPAIGEAVRDLCRHSGLNEADAGLVELGIVETINNVIEHAFGGAEQTDGRIDVRLRIDDDRVEAMISDEGAAADPATFLSKGPPSFNPAERESLPEGGFGLGVVHQVFDDVKYERDGAWNRLTLTRSRQTGR